MKDYCQYVNVFQGCDEIDLPTPEGIAAKWKFIKGRCGNNTPAAALPFGRLTACCFSGGYSSGYGRLMVNSEGAIRKLGARNQFKGIAHLQNDGTGYIDTYYNYAVISPFTGELKHSARARDFENERARPGYYACADTLTGADCETTVTPRAALTRMTFPNPGACVSIDFSNDGLYDDGGHINFPAGRARLELISETEIAVCAELHALPVYFYASVRGASTPIRLWVDGNEIGDKVIELPPRHTFGAVFGAGAQVQITLGLSPKHKDIARRDALENALNFDEAKARAYQMWNAVLSSADAEFDSARDYEIFYSNLYHSFVKPCDWSGESFLYDAPEFVLEFATLWDQYKTSLPLICTLFADMSTKIARTMLNTAAATGRMPHTFMMRGDFMRVSTTQARMLAEHTIVDAYLRGADIDVDRALELMCADAFERGHYDDFMFSGGNAGNNAFVIDITDACAACALMARENGRPDLEARFMRAAARWREVFDARTGLIKDEAQFYEGSKWNYSFRLMHDMSARVALAGGKARFAALADSFFGISAPPGDGSCLFEGFNNETDMESPYVYHFADRHDRLCEVIDAGLTYMFATGRGGVPGNNDSGGLCALYIWNAIGIFPVSGQDLMIIGSPRARKCVLKLANGKEFEINKRGEGIYVENAELDGEVLDTLAFTARRLMRGGALTIYMTADKTKARRA